jgi:hypothetical protein
VVFVQVRLLQLVDAGTAEHTGPEGSAVHLYIEEKDGKLIRTRDGSTTAFVYCGGTRFLSYDPGKDYDQGVRHEFLIRNGKAWGVRCGSRIYSREDE